MHVIKWLRFGKGPNKYPEGTNSNYKEVVWLQNCVMAFFWKLAAAPHLSRECHPTFQFVLRHEKKGVSPISVDSLLNTLEDCVQKAYSRSSNSSCVQRK